MIQGKATARCYNPPLNANVYRTDRHQNRAEHCYKPMTPGNDEKSICCSLDVRESSLAEQAAGARSRSYAIALASIPIPQGALPPRPIRGRTGVPSSSEDATPPLPPSMINHAWKHCRPTSHPHPPHPVSLLIEMRTRRIVLL